MAYERVSDDAHIIATQEALQHWDKRRAHIDSGEAVGTHIVGQVASRVHALLRALAWMQTHGLDVERAHVLDVGCAQGYGLRPFTIGGFSLDQLHGIDLFADRVEHGRRLNPGMDLRVGDATAMPYSDKQFDIVCEQFCFCHIPDSTGVKARIAQEMMRVSREWILIHDWRAGSESRKLYGVSQARIREWFPGWAVAARFRSQLWPPLGRALSLYAPLMYDAARIASPLVGSWITVLRKA